PDAESPDACRFGLSRYSRGPAIPALRANPERIAGGGWRSCVAGCAGEHAREAQHAAPVPTTASAQYAAKFLLLVHPETTLRVNLHPLQSLPQVRGAAPAIASALPQPCGQAARCAASPPCPRRWLLPLPGPASFASCSWHPGGDGHPS